MTTPLDDEQLGRLLRGVFDHDSARVPLVQPEWDGVMRLRSHRAPPPRRGRALVAVAAALVVAVGMVWALAINDDSAESVASEPTVRPPSTTAAPSTMAPTTMAAPSSTTAPMSTTTVTTTPGGPLSPPVTLAPGGDTTVPPDTRPTGPPAYYRFAPDLDLAWVNEGAATQLCWRTPADESCQAEPDPGAAGVSTVVIPSSAQHTLVLVSDTRGATGRARVTVTLTSGDTFSGAPRWDDPVLSLGLLRVPFPAASISEVHVA